MPRALNLKVSSPELALKPKPLSERATHKKQRILDAGLKIFLQHGFTGAGMDQIASEAGVSKPTIYRYFQNKEDLFAEILKRVSDQMLSLAEHPADQGSLEATLCAVANNAASVVLSDDVIALQRLVTGEFARFPQLTRGFFENGPKRAISGFGKMLRVLRGRGEIDAPDLNTAAHHFWSLTIGMPHRTKLIDPDWAMTDEQVRRWINAGVAAFLRLYAHADGAAAARPAGAARTRRPAKG